MLLQSSILLLIFRFSLQMNENDLILLINDFLKIENSPVAVNCFICWNKDYSKSLSTTLSKNYYYRIFNEDQDLKYLFPEKNQLIIIDLKCAKSIERLKQAEKLKMLKHPFRWLIIGNSSLLSDFYFAIDSKIFTIEETENVYEIKALFKYSENNTFNDNKIMKWSKNEGISEFQNLSIVRSHSNLMGTTIKICYVLTNLDSLNHLSDYRFTHIDAITKLNYIIIENMLVALNATGKFRLHQTWGYKNKTTGIFSGTVGDLQKGLADITASPMFFTWDRMEVVDFIAATTPTYMKFIFKAPSLSHITNIFTLPFETTVWHYSFIVVILFCLLAYIIVVWEWKEPEFRDKLQEDSQLSLRADFYEVVMMALGAASQQGYDSVPKSNSGRIATGVVFLVLMFLYTAYSANIVALLQSTSDSIRTPSDLLNSHIELGIEDIVYAHYYFKSATEPTRMAVYQQKIAPKGQKPHFMTVNEGIKRLRNEFFAFHVELTTGYKIIADTFEENEKCSLKELTFFRMFEPMLAVQKNSTFTKFFKIALWKIRESGIRQREYNKIYTRKVTCHSRENTFNSVGFVNCYFAFLFFTSGIILSFVLFLFEIVVGKYNLICDRIL